MSVALDGWPKQLKVWSSSFLNSKSLSSSFQMTGLFQRLIKLNEFDKIPLIFSWLWYSEQSETINHPMKPDIPKTQQAHTTLSYCLFCTHAISFPRNFAGKKKLSVIVQRGKIKNKQVLAVCVMQAAFQSIKVWACACVTRNSCCTKQCYLNTFESRLCWRGHDSRTKSFTVSISSYGAQVGLSKGQLWGWLCTSLWFVRHFFFCPQDMLEHKGSQARENRETLIIKRHKERSVNN